MKKYIKEAYEHKYEVFVSSDPNDISPGQEWLDRIKNALKLSKLIIVLCSSKSVVRPWINFEAGCCWIRNIPVLSICHSDMNISDLPEPLCRFQSTKAENINFTNELFIGLEKQLGSMSKEINREEMKKDINNQIDLLVKESTSKKINSNKTIKTSQFSEEENTEYQYIYDKLNRMVEISCNIFERRDGNQMGDKIREDMYLVSYMDILVMSIKGGETYCDKRIIEFSLKRHIEEKNLLKNIEGYACRNVRISVDSSVKLVTYGLISIIEGRSPKVNSLKCTEKMFRLIYWLECNNLIREIDSLRELSEIT